MNYWNVARKCVAAVWDAHSWIYHGYEVVGMEHIPADGAALIVYYHGAIPIDMYYLVARICLVRDRLIHTVGDRFLFKLPGNYCVGCHKSHFYSSYFLKPISFRLGNYWRSHESVSGHGANMCEHLERRQPVGHITGRRVRSPIRQQLL